MSSALVQIMHKNPAGRCVYEAAICLGSSAFNGCLIAGIFSLLLEGDKPQVMSLCAFADLIFILICVSFADGHIK
jgi:hypothetical protein